MTFRGRRWNFRITPIRVAMFAIFFVSLIAIFYRYYTGLGAVTNLDDMWTWGLWIMCDMNVIALAGAGFSMAIITHIFHVEKFEPLSRRCLLISFLGYILVLLILIIEIGRWDNFWRPFVSPGIHSPMFEVYMCITAYLILQVIELIEVGSEKVAPKFNHKMHKIMPVVFIIACVVPLGHQASLGALYLAMPAKLDGLWNSHMMPWLFLLSSFMVGPAVAIVENIWTNHRYKTKTDTEMLHGLTRISAVCMVIYFVAKTIDLVVRGELGNVFAFDLQGNMFILEMVLLCVVPVIISILPVGKSVGGLLVFGISAMLGTILTRFNVVYTGMVDHLGATYFPTFFEIFSTVGLFLIIFLVYVYITENFPFFYGIPSDCQNVEEAEASKSGFNQAIM